MTVRFPLLPPPRQLEFGPADSAWILDWDSELVLPASVVDRLQSPARQLQATVQEATGLPLPIRVTLAPHDGANRIVLSLGTASPDVGANFDELGPEGYVLHIDTQRVTLTAPREAGLFYGVQTLRQLFRAFGRRLPLLTIRDWPVLPNRGVMLDVSRGKVPTRESLFRLVDLLASLKYNHFQLYIEHTFLFSRHPEISAGSDPLTPDDVLALDRYCRERHIELVPNLQSFGHQRRLLSLPQYAHLDEVGWRWSLTPAREETYQLLDELYADFLPNFTSSWLNVDCDETWDLGTGQSKPLAQELGKGRLYLRHILRLRELAARYGRHIMIWADILLHYPELVSELPDDILLLDWHYEAQEHYPTATLLGSLGRRFWVCPGTSSWNTLFPRIANALANIRTFVRDGLTAGASGMLLTDWGDYGHYQPLSLSLYPYAVGAAISWSGPDVAQDTIDAAFAIQLFGRPAGDPSVRALQTLGSAVTAPTLGQPNRSNSALALFDEPLAGRLIEVVDPAALAQLREAALTALASWSTLPDPLYRLDYTFAARLVAFAAEKLQASQELRALLRQLPHPADPAARADGLTALDRAIARLGTHRARLAALRDEFAACWLRHARRGGMDQTLNRFAALDQRYQDALNWLRAQRGRYATGEPIDAELNSYATGGYRALWEEGLADILELARLVGVEELPPDIRHYLEHAGLLGGLSTV
ncbi:Beta-hexosaminidase [bacterium HR28]|nr:Beta-hexosaminidase [bacterium HR28]